MVRGKESTIKLKNKMVKFGDVQFVLKKEQNKMCDKGILESMPTASKLEYCIIIPLEMRQKYEKKLSELLKEEVFMYSPKIGKYPSENPAGLNTVSFALKNTGKTYGIKTYYDILANFSLRELSGCCGVIVSYWMQVDKKYRGKGIAKVLQEFKEEICKYNGYTTMLATTLSGNDTENHILEKFNWKQVYTFKNKRTQHNLIVWIKEIK